MQERKLYECIVVVKLDVLDLGVGGGGGAAIRDDLSLGCGDILKKSCDWLRGHLVFLAAAQGGCGGGGRLVRGGMRGKRGKRGKRGMRGNGGMRGMRGNGGNDLLMW